MLDRTSFLNARPRRAIDEREALWAALAALVVGIHADVASRHPDSLDLDDVAERIGRAAQIADKLRAVAQ